MAKAPRKRAVAPRQGKAAPKSPPRAKSSPKAPRTASAPKIRGGYEVICSECYNDFDFNPSTTTSQVTCPICMHVGSVAEREDQARFQIAKGRERSKFLGGLIPGVLFLVVGLVWLFLLNREGTAEQLGAGLNYGLLGAAMILLIITVFQSVKYEAARYEVYF